MPNTSSNNTRENIFNLSYGAFSGAMTLAMVTPLENYAVLKIKGRSVKPLFNDPKLFIFGLPNYSLSAAFSFAISFLIYERLKSTAGESAAALIAGGISGFALVPQFAIAQNKLTSGLPRDAVSKMIYKNHGLFGFFRGAVPIVVAEACWTLAYRYGSTPIAAMLFKLGCEDQYRELVSNAIAGFLYGVASTPAYGMRIHMQSDLCQKVVKMNSYKSYFDQISRLKLNPFLYVFQGGISRGVVGASGCCIASFFATKLPAIKSVVDERMQKAMAR